MFESEAAAGVLEQVDTESLAWHGHAVNDDPAAVVDVPIHAATLQHVGWCNETIYGRSDHSSPNSRSAFSTWSKVPSTSPSITGTVRSGGQVAFRSRRSSW